MERNFRYNTIFNTFLYITLDLKRIFQNISQIEEYIINEFGDNFFHFTDEYLEDRKKYGSHVWFADQSFISYKINEWRKR